MPNPPPKEGRSTRKSSTRSTRREPPKPAKNRRRGLLLPLLLLTLGVMILLYQPVMNYWIGPVQLERAYANELSADDIQQNAERHKNADYSDDELDALFDADSVETLTTLPANPKIDTRNVIGGIYAPSVGMTMPIMYGFSQNVLKSSAGTMKRDQQMGMGNYALIGHNSKNPNTLFAPTHRLKAGDAVYITNKQTVYLYTVKAVSTVSPSEIGVIDDGPGEPTLTLISCTDDSKSRVVVRAELTETFNYEEAAQDVIKAFNDL